VGAAPDNSAGEDAEDEELEKTFGPEAGLDLPSEPVEHQAIEDKVPGKGSFGGMKEPVGQEGMDPALGETLKIEGKIELEELASKPVTKNVLEQEDGDEGNEDGLDGPWTGLKRRRIPAHVAAIIDAHWAGEYYDIAKGAGSSISLPNLYDLLDTP